jgi:hypothetical protein
MSPGPVSPLLTRGRPESLCILGKSQMENSHEPYDRRGDMTVTSRDYHKQVFVDC